MVRQLPREPGKRESRFIELISEAETQLDTQLATQPAQASSLANDELVERVALLEQQVAELKLQVAELLGKI